MRGWIASAAIIAAASISIAVFALQNPAEPLPTRARAIAAAPQTAVSPDRDRLTAEQADAAHRANLLPADAKSLLKTSKPLRHGEFQWNDKDVPAGKLSIWVDLRRQMISVFRGGHEIGTSVIVYGADGMASPTGRFPILSKQRDYHSRAYDAPMPYSLFITNGGVALHGSPVSSRHATHGCIGLPVGFARLLFEVAKTGDQVEVVSSDPATVRQLATAPKG